MGMSCWNTPLISGSKGLLRLDRSSVIEFQNHQRKPVRFLLTPSIKLTTAAVLEFVRFIDRGIQQRQS